MLLRRGGGRARVLIRGGIVERGGMSGMEGWIMRDEEGRGGMVIGAMIGAMTGVMTAEMIGGIGMGGTGMDRQVDLLMAL